MSEEQLPPGVSITPPDQTLKHKVGHGGFNVQNIAKAEKRLVEARSEFPLIARRELQAINWSLQALQNPARLLEDIFAAAVDLKSNSGLFSYDTISAIADSLMTFTEGLTVIDQNNIIVIQLHYDALQLVFEQGHDVMTQSQRVEMLQGLKKAVQKYKQAHA